MFAGDLGVVLSESPKGTGRGIAPPGRRERESERAREEKRQTNRGSKAERGRPREVREGELQRGERTEGGRGVEPLESIE